MSTTVTPTASPSVAARPSPRQQFLDAYEREHAITMKLLRAYPPDKGDLRPHPKSKTARDLAWIFALESGLGKAGLANAFAGGNPGGAPPPAPESWSGILSAIEAGHVDFRNAFESYSDEQLFEPIKFFTGPKTLTDIPRLEFAWFVMTDQIHHRGQLSVYLRMADGRVPSIYGPSGDEPWF